MRSFLLASVGAASAVMLGAVLGTALTVSSAHAQLDLSPPAPTPVAPAATPARRAAPRPSRPVARAPHVAPLPLPRPDAAGEATPAEAAAPATEAASAPASVPPASPPPVEPASGSPVPPPAPAPALAGDSRPAEAPAGPALAVPANRIDEAFQATAAAQAEAAPIPESPPSLPHAPLPAARPAEIAAAATDTPASAPAEAPPPSAPRLAPPFAEAPARRVEGRAFSEQRYPVGRDAHLATIRKFAEASRVPIDLADAVATIESAYDPQAVGSADEIGIMQVRSTIAREQGFEGTVQELFEPETNIRLGVGYLAGAWERSGGNVCQALMKYRVGWDETRISPLSAEYCRRALIYLNAIGSPLARGLAAPPSLNGVAGAGVGRGTFNWTDHDGRLRQIDQRFGGENFGIIAR